MKFYQVLKKVFTARSAKNADGVLEIDTVMMTGLMHELRMKVNTIMMGNYKPLEYESKQFNKLINKERTPDLQQSMQEMDKALFEDFSLLVTY